MRHGAITRAPSAADQAENDRRSAILPTRQVYGFCRRGWGNHQGSQPWR